MKITTAEIKLLESQGIKVRNGKVNKDQTVKAAYVIRNNRLEKAQATIRVDVGNEHKEYFNSTDKMKESFKFLEEAEKKLGCPIEWDCDEKCFYLHDDTMDCKAEDLKAMLPDVSAKADDQTDYIKEMKGQSDDPDVKQYYDEMLKQAQGATEYHIKGNEYNQELSDLYDEAENEENASGWAEGFTLEDAIKEIARKDWHKDAIVVSLDNGFEGMIFHPKYKERIKKIIKPESTAAASDEISKETLEKIKKDKDLIKAANELPALEKKVEKLKKEVPPIYNKILEKYDIKEGTGRSGDGSKITDYDKLYKADDSYEDKVAEFYKEANTELMKKYPGTKDGHCPLLVAQDDVVKKENQILDLLGKYYSFVKNIYKLEDRRQLLKIHKDILQGAKAGVTVAIRTNVTKQQYKDLRSILTEVQNAMKDGMYNLNLAINGGEYDERQLGKLIEACNNAGNCEAAKIIWD